MRQHTGVKPYDCEICGRQFKSSSTLEKHIQRHRNGIELKCSFCPSKFNQQNEYKSHMEIHLNENPTINKSFDTKLETYTTQEGSNNLEKYFLCTSCNKVFSEKNSFISHTSTCKVIKIKIETNEIILNPNVT